MVKMGICACNQALLLKVIALDKPQAIEVRLDKWLWAARLFKTRQLAAKALSAGHVTANGSRVKPARMVQPGDEICVRKGAFTYTLSVLGVSQRRRPAREARLLYRETENSILERERLAAELKSRAAQVLYDPAKPSAREQRQARMRKRGES